MERDGGRGTKRRKKPRADPRRFREQKITLVGSPSLSARCPPIGAFSKQDDKAHGDCVRDCAGTFLSQAHHRLRQYSGGWGASAIAIDSPGLSPSNYPYDRSMINRKLAILFGYVTRKGVNAARGIRSKETPLADGECRLTEYRSIESIAMLNSEYCNISLSLSLSLS